MADTETEGSTLEDWKALGEEGGTDTLALVGKLMQDSADSNARIQASLYEGMETERDKWKERALRAERQLDVAAFRLQELVYAPLTDGEFRRFH